MATKQKSAICAVLTTLLLAMIFIGCGGEEVSLAAHKENAIAILTAYVQALNTDDYSDENWLAIEGIANTGKENINMAVNKPEVNLALNAALKEIHMVDYEGRDFVYTIRVVEGTTWITTCMIMSGENFRVAGELKNISGKDHEVVFGPFIPVIPGKYYLVDGGLPPYPNVELFKSGNIRFIGASSLCAFYPISQGVHQLTFRGMFHLGWEQPGLLHLLLYKSDIMNAI